MLQIVDCEMTSLAPLDGRVSDLPVLNRRLGDVLAERLSALPGEGVWQAVFWPSPGLPAQLAAAPAWRVVAADGEVLAEGGTDSASPPRDFPADGVRIRYPWDVLIVNEREVALLDADRIEGEIKAGVWIEGHIVLGAGSVLLPGVYVEGNAIIGCDCKIGPNCYIRGNTVIGDGCHVGQAVEVKNSVLMNRVSAGHLSYIGDSVVAPRVNFGAGTIISNLRHDGANHRSMVDGVLLDTGRRKFGAIIGENVHTGIHSAIYPGRKIWPGVSTLPGDVIRTDRHD